MRRLFYILSLVLAVSVGAGLFSSCDDNAYTIGSSLVTDSVDVVMDSSFVIQGRSVVSERVQSRTTTQLIGRLQAEGYGSIESSIVTQFMPGMAMETSRFKATDIDSVKLIMHMANGAYTGDSLMPMGLKVYPLKRQLPSPIYSDFDPKDYYDPSDCWGSAIYTASALGQSDSIAKLPSRQIQVKLPRSFAVDIYNQYVTSPSTFSTPQSFAQWFPGVYISNSFGSGRVTRIDRSYITMYYHVDSISPSTGRDSTYYYTNTFLAVTPEIVTNNNIDYDMASALSQRVASGEVLIVAPTGYDIEVDFPAQELVDYYRTHSGPVALLNGLSFRVPGERIPNKYGIGVPANILFVKKSKAAEFFNKNMITDGVNAFYATYDQSTGMYDFGEMRPYLQDLLDKGGTVAKEDSEFLMVPISVVTESNTTSSNYYYYYYTGSQAASTVVTSIVPYITTPVMARLRLDKARIRLTFTKQTF